MIGRSLNVHQTTSDRHNIAGIIVSFTVRDY